MNPIVRPGQAAGVKIKELRRTAYKSLYQEWLKQGNSGSFDDFMTALRPDVDAQSLRRAVQEVLAENGQTSAAPAAGLSKAALDEILKVLGETDDGK